MGRGKLMRFKSVLKKLQSFGNQSRSSAITADHCSSNSREVYVGKSRRRYVIASDITEHPVFRELAERSGDGEILAVGCEVVLFEHLLWMLGNGDTQPETLDEFVYFYAC